VLEGKAALPADQQTMPKPRPAPTNVGNGNPPAATNPKPASAVVE
jgi:hypothetical protein